MGKGNFRPPQNRHPLTDHQKICHMWLGRRPLRLCQIRCISVDGGLLGKWVKYNQNYFYLYLFWGTRLQVRRVDGFSRTMVQTTRTRARMCLLGTLSHYCPLRGSKPPKNNFGAWIGVFKPNSWNRKTCILSKLLHRIQPNFTHDHMAWWCILALRTKPAVEISNF